MISIYVGGASKEAPGTGGWASLLVDGWGNVTRFSGSELESTRERMGLKAVVEGLLRIAPGSQATVYSNSDYLSSSGRASASDSDRDLWTILDRLLARRSVSWEQINDWSEEPYHDEALRLARRAAGLREAGPVVTGEDGDARELGDAGQQWEDVTGLSLARAEGVEDPAEGKLTHIDEEGEARMVDVSRKAETERIAVARGRVLMTPPTLELIRSGTVAKGDVLSVARIAGIMGAKRTAELIPLCHPLMLTDIAVDFELDEAGPAVEITAAVKTMGKTGVEMEALTAVSVSALTIYDMCKAADRGMRIDGVRLTRKTGGKSGDIVLE